MSSITKYHEITAITKYYEITLGHEVFVNGKATNRVDVIDTPLVIYVLVFGVPVATYNNLVKRYRQLIKVDGLVLNPSQPSHVEGQISRVLTKSMGSRLNMDLGQNLKLATMYLEEHQQDREWLVNFYRHYFDFDDGKEIGGMMVAKPSISQPSCSLNTRYELDSKVLNNLRYEIKQLFLS